MATVRNYHSGKGGYENLAYILSKDTGELLRTNVNSLLEDGKRAFGFEFELEFDPCDYEGEPSTDALEYITVWSEDYQTDIEVANPYYDCDAQSEGVDFDQMADDIEACFEDYHDGYVHYEHDGSLDCGVEMITQPMTKNAMKKWLNESGVSRVFQMADTDNSSCGCHLHVSKLPTDDVFKMAYIMAYMGDSLRSEIRNSSYGEIWRFDKNDPLYFVSKLANDNIVRRSYALADNCNDGKTIEFRLFAMTKKISRYEQYLDFATSVIELSEQMTWEQIVNSNFELQDDLSIVVTARDTEYTISESILKTFALRNLTGKVISLDLSDMARLLTYSMRVASSYSSISSTHTGNISGVLSGTIPNEFRVRSIGHMLTDLRSYGDLVCLSHVHNSSEFYLPIDMISVG
jgi:hypothetical protein